jgi:hypothetical protein
VGAGLLHPRMKLWLEKLFDDIKYKAIAGTMQLVCFQFELQAGPQASTSWLALAEMAC